MGRGESPGEKNVSALISCQRVAKWIISITFFSVFHKIIPFHVVENLGPPRYWARQSQMMKRRGRKSTNHGGTILLSLLISQVLFPWSRYQTQFPQQATSQPPTPASVHTVVTLVRSLRAPTMLRAPISSMISRAPAPRYSTRVKCATKQWTLTALSVLP